MATTNDFAHAFLRIREFARIWNLLRKYSSDTTLGDYFWPALESIIAADKCVFDPDVQQGEIVGMLAQRALVAGVLTAGRSLLDPLMLQLSRAMGYPQTDPTAVFPILYKYMANNEGTFKSAPRVTQRGITRGSYTAVTSQGNGTVLRQNLDRYGLPIESDSPDVYKLLCVKDANSGTNPGMEQFAVTGQPFRDSLARYVSGNSIGVGNNIPTGNLVGNTCDGTRNLITNPSFADFTGSGATFALNGWTVTSGAFSTCSVDTTNYYRASNIESTPGALKTTASITLTTTIPASQLNAALCYMLQGACNFSIGGATGSVRLQVGTAIDVTVASGVGGWNLIRPTINKNLWFVNFATTTQITVTLTITVSSGSYILVDDIVFQPFQSIGGKLLWAIGGSTNWVVNDSATITDSVPTTTGVPTSGLTQTMLAEVYGQALPAYAPATAPVSGGIGIASTTGGTTAKGRYGVVVTFYASGTLLESAASAEINVFLDATNNRIALTSIPTGPGGTTDRYVYVTQLGDYNDITLGFGTPLGPQSAYYFCAALGDNVATSKTIDPATLDLTKPLAVLQDI